MPVFVGSTNGDLLNYALDLRATASEANSKLEAICEWARGIKALPKETQ
jgi:hypothetical protein